MTKSQRDALLDEIGKVIQRLERGALVAGFAAAAAFAPLRASAAAFAVTTLDDDGVGSLRAAVVAAEASAGPDTIDIQVTGSIVLATPLAISESLHIQGAGNRETEINGGGSHRIIATTGTDVELRLTNLGLVSGLGSGVNAGAIDADGQQLVLDNVRVSFNGADGEGGAIRVANGSLEVLDSEFTDNWAQAGGAIFASASDVTLRNTRFADNYAQSVGGAVRVDDGTLGVDGCTFVRNAAEDAGGAVYTMGQTQIVNSTFAFNQSTLLGVIAQTSQNKTTEINHTTVAFNTGKGASVPRTSLTTVKNSIFASNSDTDLEALNSKAKAGAFIAFNLIQLPSLTLDSTNIVGVDPMLGALQNNGGTQDTLLPIPYSPVVNAGDPDEATPPATDQRGGARVLNGRLDIGAVERPLPRLFASDVVTSGSECTYGGLSFDEGADLDRDGLLQPDEVDTPTRYVCNGAPGADGLNGADGAEGMNGADAADGADGEAGADGANGADGQKGGCNSVTPSASLFSLFALWLRRRRST